MLNRTTVGVLVLAGALLVGFAVPAATQAQGFSKTWDDAAGVMKVPVYRPTKTLGLRRQGVGAEKIGCRLRHWIANAYYGPAKKRLSVTQADSVKALYCGASRRFVRRIRVAGRVVKVWRVCGDPGTRCRPRRRGVPLHLLLQMRGGPGNKTTMVAVSGYNLGLARLLKVARSLRRIDPKRATVEFSHFRVAGGSIKCPWTNECYTKDDRFGGGVAREDGSVGMCGPCQFVPLMPSRVPTLNPGQATVYNGYRCAAGAAAVTCTIAEGPTAGRGFRIDPGSVTQVGPAP